MPQHLLHVYAVAKVVLHVRVPHEVGQLVRHHHALRLLKTQVQELHVVPVTLTEVQQLEWKFLHESALTQAARHQPLLVHLGRAIVQRMQLVGHVH